MTKKKKKSIIELKHDSIIYVYTYITIEGAYYRVQTNGFLVRFETLNMIKVFFFIF